MIVGDGRYWAYEYCQGGNIKQFHPLAKGVAPGKDDQYLLGAFDSKVKTLIAIEDNEGGRSNYLKQEWGSGTLCDLNGIARSTKVEYHCAAEEKVYYILIKIVSVREISTCRYKLVINTPRLCSELAFVKQKVFVSSKIVCVPRFKTNGRLSNGPLTISEFMTKPKSSRLSLLDELPFKKSSSSVELLGAAIQSLLKSGNQDMTLELSHEDIQDLLLDDGVLIESIKDILGIDVIVEDVPDKKSEIAIKEEVESDGSSVNQADENLATEEISETNEHAERKETEKVKNTDVLATDNTEL